MKITSNIENIEFIPGVPKDKLKQIYGDAKALLVTSEAEGYPNVILESWSHSRPVFSRKYNCFENISESNGYISANTINDFILKIRSYDDEDLTRIGINGYKYINKVFLPQKIVKNIYGHIVTSF